MNGTADVVQVSYHCPVCGNALPHLVALAALVGMKKRLQASGCTLVLCGLRPIVREVFDRLRLTRLFDTVKSEEHVAVCA